MTERSGMSRRQALMYGGLAAAVPLLPAVRHDKQATPSGARISINFKPTALRRS